MHARAVLVRQFEVRRNGVQRKHRQSLADLDRGVDHGAITRPGGDDRLATADVAGQAEVGAVAVQDD